jgi:hypothetical protein
MKRTLLAFAIIQNLLSPPLYRAIQRYVGRLFSGAHQADFGAAITQAFMICQSVYATAKIQMYWDDIKPLHVSASTQSVVSRSHSLLCTPFRIHSSNTSGFFDRFLRWLVSLYSACVL